LRCWRSISAASPRRETVVEILERLLETHLGRIELAHRRSKPIFREVIGRHADRLRDQLHRAHRGLVVAVGEHVDVRVGHSPPVELAGCVGQASIGEAVLFHEGAQSVPERL
jgi:hypothetical protein